MESRTDAYFINLHHRRVAGEILSGDEREGLESLLAQRDAEEMKRLALQIARMNEEAVALYSKHNERPIRISLLQDDLIRLLRTRPQ